MFDQYLSSQSLGDGFLFPGLGKIWVSDVGFEHSTIEQQWQSILKLIERQAICTPACDVNTSSLGSGGALTSRSGNIPFQTLPTPAKIASGRTDSVFGFRSPGVAMPICLMSVAS